MSGSGYSSTLTSIYSTLTSGISAIDFGDRPEDGNGRVLPAFTGGSPDLFPEEHDGRVGESIKTVGVKINENFNTIYDAITGVYSYVDNLELLANSRVEINIQSNSIDTSVQPGMCVYIDSTGMYKPFTYAEQYTETYVGVYVQNDILHSIYTNGYASNIGAGLIGGTTYGLLSGNNSPFPVAVDDSYSYICNDSFIPIFRAINDTDGILLSHSITIPLSSAYI